MEEEILIRYRIEERKGIRLFGKNFIKNNKNKM